MNAPLTEQDIKLFHDGKGICLLEKVQSAKRLLELKIKDRITLLKESSTGFDSDRNLEYESGIYELKTCLSFIDACFQISDGDDKND
jgi:hypothetical protein